MRYRGLLVLGVAAVLGLFSLACSRDKNPLTSNMQSIRVSAATGGEVATEDKQATVSVPPDALPADTTITIEPVTNPPDTVGVIGPVWAFGPEGLQFNRPVTITLAYDPKNLPAATQETDLLLGVVEGERFVQVVGSQVDTSSNQVQGPTSRFSLFAVIDKARLQTGALGQAVVVNTIGNTGSISIIDLNTGQVQNDILDVGQFPDEMEVQGAFAYVVNSGTNNISLINLSTLTLTETIEMGANTSPQQITFAGNKAYVSELFTNRVAVIDLDNRSLVRKIDLPASSNSPRGLAVANGKLYVTQGNFDQNFNPGPGTVSVVDLTTNAVVDSIPVGRNPTDAVVDGDGQVNVICAGITFPAEDDGSVYVIDPATDQVVTHFDIGGSPFAIDINAQGVAYLGGFGTGILSYDTATNTVLRSSANPLGTAGREVAFDSRGNIYVTDSGDFQSPGFVLVYNVDEQFVRNFAVGVGPGPIVVHKP